MTPPRSATRSREAGYTLVELLVSTAIMVTVTGAIFSLMNPAQGNAQTQPEVADMQQRMRVGNDTLFKELVMSGAGPYQGPVTGSLINFFAPIIPRRIGFSNPDPATVFREDTITLSYIPNSYSQTTISSAMPQPSAELKVTPQPNCPADGGNLCGFQTGMDVIIFDTSGNFDMFTITNVQDSAAHLQHRGQDLSKAYDVGASVTQIVSNTYYLNTQTNQLMRYDGYQGDVPLVDNVVGLKFEYFGDPSPPMAPKPPAGEANCLYDAAGNLKGLATLAADEGSLAPLPAAILTDGPMCGGGTNQFDADLLRVRKVRVTMRVQVANPALRGLDTALFKHPGTSRGGERFVPDYNISFEVSPRNLNLVR
jgi:hypothetical protein